MHIKKLKSWFKEGDPWIWMTSAAVTVSVLMVLGLLALIAFRGLSFFWPSEIVEYKYLEDSGETISIVGEIYDSETVDAIRVTDAGYALPKGMESIERQLIKTGNRDLMGLDFRWINTHKIQSAHKPKDIFVAERYEWGDFFGYLLAVKEDGKIISHSGNMWIEFDSRFERVTELDSKIKNLERNEIGSINYELEKIRLEQRAHELNGSYTENKKTTIAQRRDILQKQYASYQEELVELYDAIKRDSISARIADGRIVELPLSVIVRYHQPNQMSLLNKASFYVENLWYFVSGTPREANTEGGIFPAIFGTVMMVIIMSIFVTPFGVVAAVYLREYANQGAITRTIRIAVNNLAGVPSIVYGVFGLGFFVYFLGGNIDQLFYAEALPAPTFGTPGILWSSLTLAILTLPVVIVATEEGLSRIPRNIREGSLALGATKFETLWKTILPMASPAIMTGLILAVARAAGEVAPLMLVGVVKLAPTLPVDENFPFLHLDRKFMHLGFHIYDVGFQSPNVEAARPLVYATALLLVVIIILLNLVAIAIRNRLREKYKSFDA